MEIKENTVYNCDCLQLMKEMEKQGIKVDGVITDPPYLIDYKSNHRVDKTHKFCNTILNDDNPLLIKEYIQLCYTIMKDNSSIYMFCNADKIDFFKKEVEETKIKRLLEITAGGSNNIVRFYDGNEFDGWCGICVGRCCEKCFMVYKNNEDNGEPSQFEVAY